MDGGDLPFVNLELNDSPMGLDPSSSSSTTRPRRFLPKLKANSIHSSSSAPQPPPPHPPRPDHAAAAPSPRSPAPPPPLETEQSVAAVAPMEEDDAEEEDAVVREIDVYCCPLEGDAQLYVMQYPLRPYWRPYELEERCEEVKVNSKSSEVELVLRAHDDSDPYDEDEPKPTKIKEQILKSSRSIYPVDIVAGTLIKNQLYLNPVHEVLQFRPSLDHLNDDGVQKGKHKVGEVGNKSEKTTISLQFHETNSSFSRRYYQKMLVQRDDPKDFTMNQYDYLHSFCPPPSTDKRTAKVSPSSFKPSLPLEERLKEYLRTVSQLNRFDALRHLDSSAPEEEFLKMLDRHALLVQGLWVSKSSLFFEGRNANLRDYILFLFSQSHAVKASKLSNLLRPEHLRKLLRPLAYERPTMKDWKLKEERDASFIKGHMQIVKDQENAWLNRGKDLEESLFKGRNVQSLSSENRPAANMAKRKLDADKVDIMSNSTESGGRGNLPAASMSTEYRESLRNALRHIFKDRNARSMNTILRDLRELAISMSGQAKEDSKMKALVDAISNAASSQTPELLSVLKDVAYRVHDMYVFRSGLNPAHNPFRGVVVKLFCEKESNVELKKQEIVEAVKTMLNKEISKSEYDQVVKDLCVHKNRGWALRTVDNLD